MAHLEKNSVRRDEYKYGPKRNVLGVGKVGDQVRKRVGLNYGYHTNIGVLCVGNAMRNGSLHVLKLDLLVIKAEIELMYPL